MTDQTKPTQNGNPFPISDSNDETQSNERSDSFEATETNTNVINEESWIKRLKVVYQHANTNQWLLGDLLNEFADWYNEYVYLSKKSIKNTHIVKLLEIKKTSRYIIMLRKTAEAFPPEYRIDGLPWINYHRALNNNNAVQPEKRSIDPKDIYDAFDAGAYEPRQIRSYYEDKIAKQTGSDLAALAEQQPKRIGFINNIHRGRWEDIAKRFDGIKPDLIYADPPFLYNGRIKRTDNTKNTSGHDTGIYTIEDYYKTLFNLFDVGRDLLNVDDPNAVLIIHQHGGCLDDLKLQLYAKRSGWHPWCPLNWIKGKEDSTEFSVSMPDMGDAHGCSSQRILVFNQTKNIPPKRIGVNNNGNAIILPHAKHNQSHPWEHSYLVAEKIIGNYLYPNSQQIIFEPFACSAPAAIAAIKNNWRYVSADISEKNYTIGLARINEYLSSITDVA